MDELGTWFASQMWDPQQMPQVPMMPLAPPPAQAQPPPAPPPQPSPHEIAAARTAQSAQPAGGRQEGMTTKVLDATGQSVANKLGEVATLPQRTMGAAQEYTNTGQYNPAPIVEAAGTLAGGAMPMATKGSAGIFGGRLAQTADRTALVRAEQMAKAGATREQIWNDTGWFQGADKQWRFEIPDNASTMRGTGTPSQLATRAQDRSGEAARVADVLYHPELYAAYPQTRDIPFAGHDAPVSTYQYPRSNREPGRITVTNQSGSGKSPTLHELQHDIQQREKFAPGANAMSMGEGPLNEQYRRSAGEVEARNVQRRRNMGPLELKAKPPWTTQDVSDELQIVMQPPLRRGWWR